MKKSGITSPSERRSPCREPAENSAHSLKLTFVSNFLKERRTSTLWLRKTRNYARLDPERGGYGEGREGSP